MTGAQQPGGAHQARNPLAAMLFAICPELERGSRAWTRGAAIQPPRGGVDGADAHQQRVIGSRMGRWRTIAPSVIACRGDAKHMRHGRDGKPGLVAAHDPEDPDDTAPVSRANQAAAFDRMSRSSRS